MSEIVFISVNGTSVTDRLGTLGLSANEWLVVGFIAAVIVAWHIIRTVADVRAYDRRIRFNARSIGKGPKTVLHSRRTDRPDPPRLA